ncbi:MAG: hypothetical protein REH79_03365 [Spiroplasma sp.]|nr:hypothetical protein [Spiroplasma sp.]
MTTKPETDNIFIIVSLFLLTVIAVMAIIQLIIWAITIGRAKKSKVKLTTKSYQTLLANQEVQDMPVKVKQVKTTIKFANYNQKKNCLKLSKRNFEEKTVWNIYQNLINIVLIKWKQGNRKTNITLIVSTIIFYLSAFGTIVVTLIYYFYCTTGKINQIDINILSILSFIILFFLVLSWLLWTMTYEKLRKDVIDLAKTLNNQNLVKIVRRISGYKTLFPSSELLFL